MSRAGAPRVGHIDVGIGAVGDQRIGMFDHFRRDIGVEIEARHQRQILADHLAYAGEDFAFAVVEMLGDHRAMQVEIDAIRSEEHTSELQSPDTISYAVFCLKKKNDRITRMIWVYLLIKKKNKKC